MPSGFRTSHQLARELLARRNMPIATCYSRFVSNPSNISAFGMMLGHIRFGYSDDKTIDALLIGQWDLDDKLNPPNWELIETFEVGEAI
jgi:hypothetical protein